MEKQLEYQKEYDRLDELFKDVDPKVRELAEELIITAAFIHAENIDLREKIAITGMVKIHPQHPDIQKGLKTSDQFLKNSNTMAVIISKLHAMRLNNSLEGDDAFDEFIKSKNKGKQNE